MSASACLDSSMILHVTVLWDDEKVNPAKDLTISTKFSGGSGMQAHRQEHRERTGSHDRELHLRVRARAGLGLGRLAEHREHCEWSVQGQGPHADAAGNWLASLLVPRAAHHWRRRATTSLTAPCGV